VSARTVKQAGLAAAVLTAGVLWWLGAGHLGSVVLSRTRAAEFFRTTSHPVEAVEWIPAHQNLAGGRVYNDYAKSGVFALVAAGHHNFYRRPDARLAAS